MRKISGWNQPNHGPARTGTVTLRRADQFLQKLRWNGHWKQLSLGCLPPKLLPMKAGPSVSNAIVNPRNVLRRKGEIKTCRRGEKIAKQVH